MLCELADAGLSYWKVSDQIERTTTAAGGRKKLNNQVLVASLVDLKLGDPDDTSQVGGSTLASLRQAGWHLPSPKGQWSFRTGTKIDHVLSGGRLPLRSAAYVAELNGRVLAGSDDRAISDHAALVVELLDP